MTVTEFANAITAYASVTGASATSWFRTNPHNMAVGGVAGSAHRFGLAVDVIYDRALELSWRQELARRLGLRLIAEDDHDHLQPLAWPPG